MILSKMCITKALFKLRRLVCACVVCKRPKTGLFRVEVQFIIPFLPNFIYDSNAHAFVTRYSKGYLKNLRHYILRYTVGNSLTPLIMSDIVVWTCSFLRLATLQFEMRLQKYIRMGITIFKIFIWGGIL